MAIRDGLRSPAAASRLSSNIRTLTTGVVRSCAGPRGNQRVFSRVQGLTVLAVGLCLIWQNLLFIRIPSTVGHGVRVPGTHRAAKDEEVQIHQVLEDLVPVVESAQINLP